MQQQNEALEALEIGNLEYDVGGMGSEESSGSETNHAAMFLVSYRLPIDQK
jgi:hypothetical protein